MLASFLGTDIPVSSSDAQSIAAALSDKAPGGFGLGLVTSPDVIDLNDVKQNGWYSVGANSINVPPSVQNSRYSSVFVVSRDPLDIAQFCVTVIDSIYLAVRRYRIDTWYPWEYINPPLNLGVEYRTTERYLGKPVYQKVIDFGALPNNASKRVEHGIVDLKYALSVTGQIGGYNMLGFGTPDQRIVGFYADGAMVRVTTEGDFTQWANVQTYCTIKYIKK